MDFDDSGVEDVACIRCTNVPQKLLDKKEGKAYFKQFGRIVRLVIKTKSRTCTVQYSTSKAAALALSQAGFYDGESFPVSLNPKKRRSRKELEDPDWELDPEVQAELEAMSNEFAVKKKYNLRPEGMSVDPDVPTPVTPKKERKPKRSWKPEKPPAKPAKIVTSGAQNAEKQELLNIVTQQATTVEDKFRMLDARDKLFRLMRSKKQIDLSRTKHTVGTCPDMCPEKERLMREVQHQVALYEQEQGGRSMNHPLAVKQYSRSSADQEAPLPQDLRNVHVLQMTMGYLMHRIMDLCDNPDTNFAEWYHFLWDRTRGIRKDITQQEMCSQGSVELVEQCARFHIHCSARLVAEDPSVFDQKINTENLTKCLQTLKYMYHDLAIKGERCPHEPEFRAYVILLNLNDGNFMWEVQQLSLEIQKAPEIKFALDVYSALDKNNYVKFFKLVQSTTYLNACILFRYFIQVRTRALRTIVKCYAPRAPHTQFPIEELLKILAFEGVASTVDFLECFGLRVNESSTYVVLDKRMFSLPDFPYTLDRAINIIESKRRRSVGEIVCGHELPEPSFIDHVPQNSFSEDGYLDVTEFSEEIMTPVEVTPPQNIFTERSSSPQTTTDSTDSSKYVWQKREATPKTEVKAPFFVSATTTSASPVFGGSDFGNFTVKPASVSFPATSKSIFKTNDSLNVVGAGVPKATSGGFVYNLGAAKLKRLEENLSELKRQKQAKELEIRERELRHQMEESERQQREAARKNEEKLRREEENRRYEKEAHELKLSLELERRRDLEESQRRKDAEKTRAEELRKLQEAELRVELQKQCIERTVRLVVDDLISRVEDDHREQRLRELKERTLERKVIGKWRSKIATNRRKRKAVDQSPVWVSKKSVKETAEDLYTRGQDETLSLIKRYRYGAPVDISWKNVCEIKKIDLAALTGDVLIKNESKLNCLYWKVNVYLADVSEMRTSSIIESVLDEHLNWRDDYLITQQRHRSKTITYCLHKISGEFTSEADGFIFISQQLDDALLTRIETVMENSGGVAVALILDEPSTDEDKINELCVNASVSQLEVFNGPFNKRKCVESFDEALGFLAHHKKPLPTLELNTVQEFLAQHLCGELWRRVGSFAKWNLAYKRCLAAPNTVIDLYNQALGLLKGVAFSDECFAHQDFPAVFRDFLPSKIPDYLPCDYRYFPGFWRDARYIDDVHNLMDSLLLPEYSFMWPPKNQTALEENIYTYCKGVFRHPEHAFYRVMAAILREYDPLNPQNVLWSTAVEALALERISEANFAIRKPEFGANTVFNQLFVVYESEGVQKFRTEPWFYLDNAAIRKEIDVGLNRPPDSPRREEYYDVDLDKTFSNVFETPPKDITECRGKLGDIQFYMDDLEESMAIQKRVSLTFQSVLEKALMDG